MRKEHVPIAILTIEGTNCDEELATALRQAGATPEIVHLNQFRNEVERSERRRLADYTMLFVPGGFSAGDYVRAGAIFAARIRHSLGRELEEFLHSGHLVGGICNGFQVLTELGLLPGRAGGRLGPPTAVLLPNTSGRFECRPTFLRWEGGIFPPFRSVPSGAVFHFPSAHAEGRLHFSGHSTTRLRTLDHSGQILFRWVDPHGDVAGYPWNPNGSLGNVAGLTNPEGNVFGLMPHPERAISPFHDPEWTRRKRTDSPTVWLDGQRFFHEVLAYLERHG